MGLTHNPNFGAPGSRREEKALPNSGRATEEHPDDEPRGPDGPGVWFDRVLPLLPLLAEREDTASLAALLIAVLITHVIASYLGRER